MRIAVIGGGPAGLYFSLLLKKARPAADITVLERNRADDTFGWGVVFSDQTLEHFRDADPDTCNAIEASFAHWDDIDIHVRDRVITSSGHGFSGIARKQLLRLLQERAAGLGVALRFQTEIAARLGLGGADLVVAADGISSAVRARHAAQFEPDLHAGTAKFIWLGTTFPFQAFTFYFVENEHGVFQAHCYRFDAHTSTFIVECDEASWRKAGFDRLNTEQTIGACERLFARWLKGHRLLSNAQHLAAPWSSFVRVRNRRWFDGNVVLIGDAAHSAHFSIGSGTKLAMEDAIALSRVLAAGRPLPEALAAYEEERMTEALRLQNAARNSMEWFEHVKRYIALEPEQFAYSLLTRSQRVSHENLRLRDREYLQDVERWFAAQQSRLTDQPSPDHTSPNPRSPNEVAPPMFTPFRLRDMTVVNRVVVAPMDMYSAVDGTPNDFHLTHLGTRALGGAGLILTEMTCVSPEARISLGCTGMYDEAHVAAWRRIVSFVHEHSAAKIGLQLGHSGRKGSTKLPWEGADAPLDEGNWEVVAPSAVRFAAGLQVPRAMTRSDMDRVRDEFVRSTRMAIEAGFDMIELHCAHGYLLSSFLTPLSNRRTDAYGGLLEHRMRYPLEVFSAIRAVWPAHRPMSVRISATDWAEGSVTADEAVAIARAFVDAGADIIHVSTGQTTADAKPVYGRMYQTPYSDMIRNEARVPTIAVGNITEADQVNGIIAAGRADLCALARPHLVDPFWTLHAAAQLGYTAQHWPLQYLTGKRQLERGLERKASTP